MFQNSKNLAYEVSALNASLELHKQLLTDCNYDGYEGSKHDFDRLYAEVLEIVRNELPDDADCDQIVECFHEFQLEVMNGERDVCWYM